MKKLLLLLCLLFVNPASANPPGTFQPLLLSKVTTVVFNASTSDTTDQTIYNFAGISIGTAASNRCVVATIGTRSNSARTVSGVTIGGVTATLVSTANEPSGGAEIATMWVALLPTDTTANFVVTMSGNMLRMALGSYSIYNASSCTPSASNSATALSSNPSLSLTTPANGVTIATSMANSTTTANVSWIAPTIEDYELMPETVSGSMSGAHDSTAAIQTSRSITLTITTPTSGQALAAGAWGP